MPTTDSEVRNQRRVVVPSVGNRSDTRSVRPDSGGTVGADQFEDEPSDRAFAVPVFGFDSGDPVASIDYGAEFLRDL